MKFPFLASVIIFCFVIHHVTHRNNRKETSKENSFWEREEQANSTRRKPLDDLVYITIPLSQLPTELLPENDTVQSYIRTLRELEKTPIVNLTGYTNTDLKLMYGAPNITLLTRYDQSYTLLASTLQLWADILWDAGYAKEASDIMEFAVTTETDVSRTYYRLAEYYLSLGKPRELSRLREAAGKLRSANREQILNRLTELSAD